MAETFGEYVSVEVLSQRDGETVYAGIHSGTKREVCIRCLEKTSFDNDRVAQRVEKDAHAAVARKHKNLLMCLDAGTCERGVYLVLEKIHPSTLLDIIQAEGGRLGEQRCFEILYDCAMALSYLEDHEIVHRNIRPRNIFVQGKGEAQLSDVSLVPRDTQRHDLESLIYMSPQHIEGKTRIDIRDDIYALGIIGLRALGVTHVFSGKTASAIAEEKQNTDPAGLCECTDKARAFLRGCIHKDRNKRYQSAEACAIAIEEVMYGHKRPETKKHLRPKSSKHSRIGDKQFSPLPVIIALIIVFTIAGVFVLTSPLSNRDHGQQSTTPAVPTQAEDTFFKKSKNLK